MSKLDVLSQSILNIISQRVSQNASSVAVRSVHGEITYETLWQSAESVAATLIDAGVRPGCKVGVLISRSIGWPAIFLGILRARAVYVPLDIEAPAARRTAILRAANIQYLVSDLAGEIEGPTESVLILRTDHFHRSEIRRRELGFPVGEDEAYIIFTSGSSGTPKGVCVTHAQLLSSMAARDAVYGSRKRTFLHLSPIAFDSSLVGLIWPLMSGGSIVMLEEKRLDPVSIVSAIQSGAADTLLCVPVLYSAILAELDPAWSVALHLVILAGEEFGLAIAHEHALRAPYTHLYNEYGPTECAVWVSASQVYSPDKKQLPSRITIGPPAAHAEFFLSNDSPPTSTNSNVGELIIAGPSVANGYLDEATEGLAFLPPCTSPSPPFRAYRTGDLVQRLEDGQYEFLGRLDDQVKIRGYRVNPLEIERALCEHGSVHEAIVCADRRRASIRLRAFVRLKRGVDIRALASHIAHKLPSYMHPSSIESLAEWPLTANGKIDKNQLLARAEDVQIAEHPSLAAEAASSHVLQIVKNALGISDVSANANFFELGGDSILAIQVCQRLRRTGLQVSLADLYDAENIQEFIDSAGVSGNDAPPIETAPEARPQRRFHYPHYRRECACVQCLTQKVSSILCRTS